MCPRFGFALISNSIIFPLLLQKATQRPYVVLSGKVKPGQSSDPSATYTAQEEHAAPRLSGLGGGSTPLVGKRKVEAMLGIPPQPDKGRMPPPAPRRPKT